MKDSSFAGEGGSDKPSSRRIRRIVFEKDKRVGGGGGIDKKNTKTKIQTKIKTWIKTNDNDKRKR